MDRMMAAYYLLMVVEKSSGHPQLKALTDQAMAKLVDLVNSMTEAEPGAVSEPSQEDDSSG